MTDAALVRTPRLVRLAHWLMTARGCFLFVSAVFLALWLIRSLAFPATGGDDGEQLVFAQYFAIGYRPRNPSLYTWLVIVSQWLFGVSVLAVGFVKFLSIWGTCALLFAAGRRILRDDRFAALAALSPLATYFVFWDSVAGLTDSALAMVLCALTFHVFLKLRSAPHPLLYAAFGACAGLGLLAKYGYGIFLLSLLFAALFDAASRRSVFHIGSLLAVAAAAAVFAPYGLWFAGHTGETMSTDTRYGFLDGMGYLVGAAAGALLPLWLMLPAFFPGALRRVTDPDADRTALRRLIGIQLLAALAILVVVVAVSGLKIRGYYMFVLVLLPLYYFARAQTGRWRGRAMAGFALLTAVIAIGAVGAQAGRALFEPYFCGKCERHQPYDDWSQDLRAAGFERGTIVADWWPHPLDGNLKTRFPGSRVVTVKHPMAIPPDRAAGGGCLLAWTAPERRGPVVDFANSVLGAGIGPEHPTHSVQAPVRFIGGRHQATLFYLLVEEGAGRCR
jgi:4-amino-4-deoxy-L-arabinose transferase-like glycosyltransferase